MALNPKIANLKLIQGFKKAEGIPTSALLAAAVFLTVVGFIIWKNMETRDAEGK